MLNDSASVLPFFSLWEPSVYRKVQLKDIPQKQCDSSSFAILKVACRSKAHFEHTVTTLYHHHGRLRQIRQKIKSEDDL